MQLNSSKKKMLSVCHIATKTDYVLPSISFLLYNSYLLIHKIEICNCSNAPRDYRIARIFLIFNIAIIK